jgi:hypothetical protein
LAYNGLTTLLNRYLDKTTTFLYPSLSTLHAFRYSFLVNIVVIIHSHNLVVLPEKEVKRKIRYNTGEAQSADDTEAHQILGLIIAREQIGTIDLSQVTHSVDKSQGNGTNLIRHGSESDRGVGQGDTVGSPESRGHDDEEGVAGFEVVHGADDDGAEHGDGHPAGEDDAAPLAVFVGEEAADGGADEGDGEDGDGHVLGGGGLVA